MKNHAGIPPVGCEPATHPHRGILPVWESSQSELLVGQLPYQADHPECPVRLFFFPPVWPIRTRHGPYNCVSSEKQ